MHGTLKLMSLRLINEKSPLFNVYSSSLWVFVPWWLNRFFFILYLHFFIGCKEDRSILKYFFSKERIGNGDE